MLMDKKIHLDNYFSRCLYKKYIYIYMENIKSNDTDIPNNQICKYNLKDKTLLQGTYTGR